MSLSKSVRRLGMDASRRSPYAPSFAPTPSPPSDGTLAAIHDMLERLETVTDAGRQHLMSKIVAVLAAHPRAADPPVAAGVEDLRREAGKASPDGPTFVRLASPLVGALAATA